MTLPTDDPPPAPPPGASPAPGPALALHSARWRLHAAAARWWLGSHLAGVLWLWLGLDALAARPPSAAVMGAWLAALCLLLVPHLGLAARGRLAADAALHTDSARAAEESLRPLRMSAVALALFWGLAGWWLLPADAGSRLLLLSFLMAVVVAVLVGSVGLAHFDPAVSLPFALGAGLPLVVLLWREGAAGQALATGLLLFVGLVLALAAWAGRRWAALQTAGQAAQAEAHARDAALARRVDMQQQALLQAQQQLAWLGGALEHINEGVLVWDAQGRVQHANARLAALTGLPPALLATRPSAGGLARHWAEHPRPGLDSADLLPEAACAAAWPAPPPELLAAGLPLLQVVAHALPGGASLRLCRDVSAQVQAQARWQASQAELRRLGLVAAYTDNAVALLGPDRAIEWVNDGFVAHLGWTADEVLGRRPREFMRGPLGDDGAMAVLEADLARQGWAEAELRLVGRDGQPLWLAVELQSLSARAEDAGDESGGAAPRSLLLARDIRRRKQMEAELQAARDGALQAARAKTEFLSSMSHELRTPLNAILGFAQMLALNEQQGLDERRLRYVHEIRNAGDHLLALVNDVLDLSLMESGDMLLHPEPVDLAAVAAESLSLLKLAALQHRIRLPSAEGLAGHQVLADRRRLKQVLLNLLTNAIKHNRAEGQVWLNAQVEGDQVRVEVGDDGPGIAPELQGRMFVAFERLDADRRGVEGVGVGLALSRQLVARMRGEIGVHSSLGQGSRFWFTLPRPLPPECAPPDEASGPELALAALPGARRPAARSLVLYIEDNPVNAVLMEAMLAHEPAVELQVALLPEEGLALARQRRPELVLLDIQLPGMDGYEVLRRLRGDSTLAHIPAVAISANAMPADIDRGLAAGFVDYLPKPLDLPTLLRSVRRVLDLPAPQ